MQRLPTYSTLFHYKTGDEKELWGGKDMSLSLLGKYFLLKKCNLQVILIILSCRNQKADIDL